MFLKNTSSNHLDAGVGTGYFLKKQSLAKNTRLVLMDLNANSLHSCNNALKNISPQLMVHNVLDPISISIDKFDSISINYLLHCLPGTLPQKTILFKHFTEKLNPGGVLFGSTILNTANQGNYFAKKLMKIYNRKGIFSNHHDSYEAFESIIASKYTDYKLEVIGHVCLFEIRTNS